MPSYLPQPLPDMQEQCAPAKQIGPTVGATQFLVLRCMCGNGRYVRPLVSHHSEFCAYHDRANRGTAISDIAPQLRCLTRGCHQARGCSTLLHRTSRTLIQRKRVEGKHHLVDGGEAERMVLFACPFKIGNQPSAWMSFCVRLRGWGAVVEDGRQEGPHVNVYLQAASKCRFLQEGPKRT